MRSAETATFAWRAAGGQRCWRTAIRLRGVNFADSCPHICSHGFLQETTADRRTTIEMAIAPVLKKCSKQRINRYDHPGRRQDRRSRRIGREDLGTPRSPRSEWLFSALHAVGSSDLKGRNPPDEAIRGRSRSSTAFDPAPAAQADPNRAFNSQTTYL